MINIMLKLNPNLSIIENKLIHLNNNIYQIPSTYQQITGTLDLSKYNDLIILIPETIQFFGSMCITCIDNTPSVSKELHKNHKLIFAHNSINNVVFSLFCFDGISIFEFKNNDIIKQVPDFLSSYPSALISSNQDNYNKTLIKEKINSEVSQIDEQLENIKMIINYWTEENNTDSVKILKCKLIQCQNIKNELMKINNMLF